MATMTMVVGETTRKPIKAPSIDELFADLKRNSKPVEIYRALVNEKDERIGKSLKEAYVRTMHVEDNVLHVKIAKDTGKTVWSLHLSQISENEDVNTVLEVAEKSKKPKSFRARIITNSLTNAPLSHLHDFSLLSKEKREAKKKANATLKELSVAVARALKEYGSVESVKEKRTILLPIEAFLGGQ